MRSAKFWIDGVTYNIGKDTQNTKNFKTETAEGKISTKFRLPTAYYHKIYNDPKFNLSRIKKTNSTEVLLPKEGNDGDVIITGDNINEVADAREEFHLLLQSIRSKIPPRQFISIPTLSDEVKNNFKQFKDELLNREASIPNLDESVFQKPEKLHITVCVFALLDQVEIDEAIKSLHELKEKIVAPYFNNTPAQIRLKGISCMDTNLKRTNILYANASLVDETVDYNLQTVGNKMAEFFYNKGFMKELRDSVKIHVTLINTKYRKSSNSQKKHWKKRIPIDATAIMQDYKDYDFGICNFDTFHLSLMSSNSKSENGFYTPLSIAELT
ncbi:activating signal cointegrator 1 complex subunit 1-like [Atheta coriaria]|uniref:activating signal cointegrator 1 complex subunit 1-like n=1 Tax=Dalotia coriaria TaxID=877792 RepID=UPI0031F34DF2